MPASGESSRSNDSAVNNSPLTAPTHPSSSLLGPSRTLREHEPQARVVRWLVGDVSSTAPPIDAASYPSRPYGGKLFDPESEQFVDPPRSPQAVRDDAPDGATVDEAKRRSRQAAGKRPLHIDDSHNAWSRRAGEPSLPPSQEEVLPPRPPSLPQKPENPYLNSRPSSTKRLPREKARPAVPLAHHQIPSVSSPDKPEPEACNEPVPSFVERIDRIRQAQSGIITQIESSNASAATRMPPLQQTSLLNLPSHPAVGRRPSYDTAMPRPLYSPGYTSPVSSFGSLMGTPYAHTTPAFPPRTTASPPGRFPAPYDRVNSSQADQGIGSGHPWPYTDATSPGRQWTRSDSRTADFLAPSHPEHRTFTQTASPPGPSTMAYVESSRNFDPTAKEFIPSNPQADGSATGDPSAKG